MSTMLFIVVAIAGGIAALATRRWERAGPSVAVATLAVALVAALLIRPGDTVDIGGQLIGLTAYARLFVVLSAVALLLAVVAGLLTAWAPTLAPAGLLALAASTAALSAAQAPTALLLVVAAGVVALLTASDAVRDRVLPLVLARDLRATVITAAITIASVAWVTQEGSQAAIADPLFGIAYLAMGVAVAIKFGTIPLHRWVGRMADVVPPLAVPVSTVLVPAVLGLIALTWIGDAISPFLVPLEIERGIVVALALLTIILGALAAWIQDDLEHLVGYSIAQDAGFVLLALAVVDESAWVPGRMWIAVLVIAKISLATWAHAVASAYGTRRIEDLRGWGRRSPLLLVALVMVVLATIGLPSVLFVPGILVWDVRATLIGLSIAWPLSIVASVGALLAILYYGRLIVGGLSRPSATVAAAPGERPVRVAASSPDLRGRAGQAWSALRANRALVSGGLAILLALLSLTVSAGGFGLERVAGGAGTVSGGYQTLDPSGPSSLGGEPTTP
jgi:hypothetical protein